MIDEHTLARLRSQISRAEIVLFTGAGFSLSAKNRDGQPLPSGGELKQALWQICFPNEPFDNIATLGDLYGVALQHHSSALRQLLEVRLRVDQDSLPTFYQLYVELPWFRWYTLNVDDLAEVLSRKFEPTRPLVTVSATSVDSNRRNIPTSLPPLEVVHLNGIVPGPPESLTFSETQYAARIANQEPWYSRCVADITCRPTIFIGTTLNESLLWQHMELRRRRDMGGRDPRPTSILVSPPLNSARKQILQDYRINYVEGTAESFARDVLGLLKIEGNRGFTYLGEIKASQGSATVPLVSELAAERPNLQTEYLLGEEPKWSDILSNRAIERSHDTDLLKTAEDILAGRNSNTAVFLTGTAGSGKSTALMSLSLSVSGKGIPVYWLDKDSQATVAKIISTVLRSESPVMLAIDDADIFGRQLIGLVQDLSLNKDKFLGVFAMRSHRVDDFAEPIRAAGKVRIKEHVVPHLTDDDIDKLIVVLDEHNRLGKLKGASTQDRIQAFADQAGRQLLVAMIQATSGEDHERRAHDELTGLSGIHRYVYSLACVATATRHFLTKDEILLASGDQDGDALLAMQRLVARHLLVAPPPTYRVRARHRVIADLVVNKLRDDGELTDILLGLTWAVSSKVGPDVPRSNRLWRLVSRLISHDFLFNMVGVPGARHIYTQLEKLLAFDYHYLLQRGSLEVERGDIRLADQFLSQAYSLRPNDYRVETAHSYMLMRKAWENPNSVGASDLLAEGMANLKEVIQLWGNETHYPFHVLGSQSLNWAREANLAPEEKRTFLDEILPIVGDGMNRHRRRSELEGLAKRIQREILETTLASH